MGRQSADATIGAEGSASRVEAAGVLPTKLDMLGQRRGPLGGTLDAGRDFLPLANLDSGFRDQHRA
ncbi:hypothetical protein FraEuI1c_1212 [Pseudofrankia inefficax]|uniref:Uncharacterized protein n=1 Tax=Pseudofrankia inefficax (strain DSM 45817 / CECT 9037 / DDB 130130 / EuI1c) TaxID=298654 RepID=E3J2B2_PSEI1|nr:hypothetical protein FraEuI1c_1212 [Pseudofrankia inefficax]